MLHIGKYEMRSDADRDAFGHAALAVCKAAKSVEGVNDAKFFWVNPNLIGIIAVSYTHLTLPTISDV